MKRKDIELGGSAGESTLTDRSKEKDRVEKWYDNRSKVSSEDTKSSGSIGREDEI